MRAYLPLLLLAGCGDLPPPIQPDAAPVPVPPAPVAECRVEPAQRYVGQRFAPSLPEGARLATGSRSVRVIRPGDAVTMDYRTDRLNMEIDRGQIVTVVRCG